MRPLDVVMGYDIRTYPFQPVVARALGVESLERIKAEGTPILSREKDQFTPWHARFYANYGEFLNLYRCFIDEVVKPFYQLPVVYQRVPTFRIHLPDNLAVGSWHRDRDFGHQDGEVNWWLPFTRTWDTNTLWVETATSNGVRYMKPVSLTYGQYLIFDAVNLIHGNLPNLTGQTRVSCDFRVVSKRNFKPGGRTVSANRELKLGDYWDDA